MDEIDTQTSEHTTTLPAGTVTLFMSDVEGSTRLWEEQPDAMSESMSRHDALVAENIRNRSGHLIKIRGEGDAAFAVFQDAPEAVACALDLQRTFLSEPWPEGAPLRVRISLHTGEAELRGKDYYGPVVNRCARLRAIGYGQQTVLTEATHNVVQKNLPDGASLKDLGIHRLKDLDVPERVFQLVHPDILQEFPPPKSLTVMSNNLPVQLTNFVGREQDVATVKSLLQENRLVTMAGAGGMGKTRLALEVAGELIEEYPNGVWLVELAPLADPALVPAQIAQEVGVREEPGRTILDSLTDHLRPRKLVFVLDNCEHLIAAAADVVQHLLRTCPEIRILATSQGPLAVEGERLWRIKPLPVPQANTKFSVESLVEFGSVKLFLDRALQANLNFKLDSDNAAAIADICRRLDGVPLAIALAAARVRSLSPSQIDERMGERFRLLTTGAATGPTRHQTLRAAVEWSYDLLSEPERLMFRRLSVFAGGFSLEAAEEVPAGEDLDDFEVLELLSELVDKSLVTADPMESRVRYRMLESLRQFGGEKLSESGEEGDVRHRHVNWFLNFAERAEPELQSSDQLIWLDRLQEEHDNFRQSLDWSIAGHDPEQGLKLAGLLRRFWEWRGFFSEGRQWLDQALSASPQAPPAIRAKALQGAGALARLQGDLAPASSLLEESLALMRQIDDRKGVAHSLWDLANLAQIQGEHAEAQTLYEESLSIRRELNDKRGIAAVLNGLGNIAYAQADFNKARSLLEESLAINRELGDQQGAAIALQNLGNSAYFRGEYREALSLYEDGIAIQRELGNMKGIADMLNNLGGMGIAQGDYRKARSHLEESLSLRRQLGDKPGVSKSLFNLGELASSQGDYEIAEQMHEESLSLRKQLGDRTGIAGSFNALGSIAARRGDYEKARSHHEESLDIRRKLGERAGVLDTLISLGDVLADVGDRDSAQSLFDESLTIGGELGYQKGIADALHSLGRLALARGALEKARAQLEVGLETRRDLGESQGIAQSLVNLAAVRVETEEFSEAAEMLGEAFAILEYLGDKRLIAEGLEGIGFMSAARERWASAARMLGTAEGIRISIGSPIPPASCAHYDRWISALKAGIEESSFKATWAEGRALSIEQAIAAALEELKG